MKKAKKIILAVVLVIVVALLGALSYYGYRFGWGPFGGLAGLREGNSSQYAYENLEPLTDSPLKGKNICFLGSSVTYGQLSMHKSFVEALSIHNDFSYVKEAVSSTTLVDNGKKSYVSRMKGLDKQEHFDLFVCQLSTNDASRKLPLGKLSPEGTSEFDTSTIYGAMEYIITYAQETWHCPIVFYTNPYYDSAEYADMVSALHQLQNKYDIYVIDLYNDADFNAISAEQRSLYMADDIHPTRAGYLQWWLPKLESELSKAIAK